MDGQGHPEGEEDVGDVEAGVEVGADAGGEGESGVEACAVGVGGGGDCCKEADAEGVGGEEESEDGEGEGEAGGPVVDAEEMHRAGGHPVEEGWLVEEADAVDVGGDVVVALHHLAGDLDVDGVDVVEQAGGEEAADLEDEPGEDEDGEGAWAPAAGWAAGWGGASCTGFLLRGEISVACGVGGRVGESGRASDDARISESRCGALGWLSVLSCQFLVVRSQFSVIDF